MERRAFIRWTVAARRLVKNWVLALSFRARCRELAYDAPEDNGRVKKLGEECPDCICECVSVGQHGSPGRVKNAEWLHSVIIAPTDFVDQDALKITLISHAQTKGMSVLRERASSDEFRTIVRQRIKKPNQQCHGVASFSCADMRAIIAETDSQHRSFGDRLYYILDSDLPELPHHADVYATVPQGGTKAAWKAERERLLNLLTAGLTPSSEFRDGALLNDAPR
jgi:hypothetical protein